MIPFPLPLLSESSLDATSCSASSPARRPVRSLRRIRLGDDTGAVTAEYAIVIMAAVSFAGVLVAVLRSGAVQSILTELVRKALTVG